MSARRKGLRIWAAGVVILFLLYMAIPAFEGFHLGVNPLTDNEQMTRLGLQWGKYDPTLKTCTPDGVCTTVP